MGNEWEITLIISNHTHLQALNTQQIKENAGKGRKEQFWTTFLKPNVTKQANVIAPQWNVLLMVASLSGKEEMKYKCPFTLILQKQRLCSTNIAVIVVSEFSGASGVLFIVPGAERFSAMSMWPSVHNTLCAQWVHTLKPWPHVPQKGRYCRKWLSSFIYFLIFEKENSSFVGKQALKWVRAFEVAKPIYTNKCAHVNIAKSVFP